jgi:hypothetical protein
LGPLAPVELALASLPVEREGSLVGYAIPEFADQAAGRPYNGAALSPPDAAPKAGPVFCRECGRPIEADAHFCRFCGKSQADPVAGSTSTAPNRGPAGAGLEHRLRQLFPRHHLQDEFMHIGTIAAFLMALIGFVLGFFLAYSWLGTNFLLGSIALLLFLILRESTLSHIRVRSGAPTPTPSGGRTNAGRRSVAPSSGLPAEAANAESSPPATPK